MNYAKVSLVPSALPHPALGVTNGLCEHCDFFASSEQRAAYSTSRKQRALAAIHIEIFFFLNKTENIF